MVLYIDDFQWSRILIIVNEFHLSDAHVFGGDFLTINHVTVCMYERREGLFERGYIEPTPTQLLYNIFKKLDVYLRIGSVYMKIAIPRLFQ